VALSDPPYYPDLVLLFMSEGLTEGLSLQACSRGSSGFEDCVAGSHVVVSRNVLNNCKHQQKCLSAKEWYLKSPVHKHFLVLPDSRCGSYSRSF